MRYLLFIIAPMLASLAVHLVAPSQAWAKLMDPEPRDYWQLGMESLRVQQSDMDRSRRLSTFAAYHQAFASGMAGDLWLFIAPDLHDAAEAVSVHQDFYSAFATFGYRHVNVFRYGVGVGPGFIWERTKSDILANTEILDVFVPAVAARFMVDYAVTAAWEVSLQMGLQERWSQSKRDWSYGLALNGIL